MATIDDSVYFKQKTPNILEGYAKGLRLRNLINNQQLQEAKNKLTLQNLAQKKAIRNAFSQNVTQDASGNTTLNRLGVLSDLYKIAPLKAMSIQKQFQNMDTNELLRHTKIAKNLSWSATPENWQLIRSEAVKLGLPNARMLPEQFDPAFVNKWKMHTLSGEKQLQSQQNEQKLLLQRQKLLNQMKSQQITNKKNKAQVDYYERKSKEAKLYTIQKAKTHILKDRQILKYQTALQRIQNIKSLFDKVKSGKLKFTSQLLGDINNEYTSILTGQNSPPLGRQERAEYTTYSQELANLIQRVSNDPTSIRAPGILKQIKGQIDLLGHDYRGFMNDRVNELKADYEGLPDAQKAQDETLNKLLGEYGPKTNKPSMDAHAPGSIIIYRGKKYRVGDDGDSLIPLQGE